MAAGANTAWDIGKVAHCKDQIHLVTAQHFKERRCDSLENLNLHVRETFLIGLDGSQQSRVHDGLHNSDAKRTVGISGVGVVEIENLFLNVQNLVGIGDDFPAMDRQVNSPPYVFKERETQLTFQLLYLSGNGRLRIS